MSPGHLLFLIHPHMYCAEVLIFCFQADKRPCDALKGFWSIFLTAVLWTLAASPTHKFVTWPQLVLNHITNYHRCLKHSCQKAQNYWIKTHLWINDIYTRAHFLFVQVSPVDKQYFHLHEMNKTQIKQYSCDCCLNLPSRWRHNEGQRQSSSG